MKITTTDNSVIIKDGIQTIAGNAGTFNYTYNTPADSISLTKDGKLVATGALSTSTINDEALTPTNIDEKMKPIFLTFSGGGGGITEETDPIFTKWKNGTAIATGEGAIASNNGVAIGTNAKPTGNSISIGSNTSAGTNSVTVGITGKTLSESVAIGYRANSGSIANYTTVIGANAQTGGQWGVAIGHNAQGNNPYSVSVGALSTTNNAKEIGIGTYNNSISTGTVDEKTHLGIASFNSTSTVRKNVLEARQNDDLFIYKDGSQIKLQDHLGSVNRKVINVTDTKIKLDANSDLIYIWDFNDNVPFTSFTMEEDVATSTLSTTNSATIVLKFTGASSSAITVTLPKNLVYSTDADAKYFINSVNGSGSEAGVESFILKGNEMKVINIYGIGDKRIMEIDY